MKKILTILLLFELQINIFSQSGWFNVSNNNPIYYYVDIDFINDNTGYVLDVTLRVSKTTNVGNNWVDITPEQFYDVNSIDFISADTGFVVGDYGTIFKTINGGINWQILYTGYPKYIYAVHFINNYTGIAVGENRIYRTTNAGVNWITNDTVQVILYSISFINNSTGYIGGSGKIFKTTNSGNNWIQINDINSSLYAINFINNNTGYIGGIDYISKSTNGGLNWTNQFSLSDWIWDIKFINGNTGFAVGGNSTILKTTNAGLNWFFQSNGIINFYTSVFFLNSNTGFVCGRNGLILKTTNGGGPIGIQPISTEIPNQFSLLQNYPNPFNPTTKIRFDIAPNVRSRTSNVKIVIYDMLGREIVILVNEELKPGTYEADFDGANLPSGTYFYRLVVNTPRPDESGHPSPRKRDVPQEGNYTETKKMVLLK